MVILSRFGFELVEYIASLYNCDIEIIDNTEKSEQQELVEELIEEGGEDNDKNNSSNVNPK